MRLERGIAKNFIAPRIVIAASFDLQVLQIPAYARVGGMGLNIDRCISHRLSDSICIRTCKQNILKEII